MWFLYSLVFRIWTCGTKKLNKLKNIKYLSWDEALHVIFYCWLVAKSDSCDPVDCSPPGSSVHGIFHTGILEWVAISFSRGSLWPRDWTCISYIGRWILYHWTTRVALCNITFPKKKKKDIEPQESMERALDFSHESRVWVWAFLKSCWWPQARWCFPGGSAC